MSQPQLRNTKLNKHDIHLSKTLSWLLRHAAIKEGLKLGIDGYVNVSDILNHTSLKNKYSIEDIKRVVENNDKKRFCLKTNNFGALQICANQGHSIKEVGDSHLTTVSFEEYPTVIHGTYFQNWQLIKCQGIRRMSRNHIHFAVALPSENKVISGARNNCEIFIYIDVKAAILDGIKFFKSSNDVILSPGNSQGIILPKYFAKVVDNKGNILL